MATSGNPAVIASEAKMTEQTASTPGTDKTPKEPLSLVPTKGKTKGKGSKEITYNQLSRIPVDPDEFMKLVQPTADEFNEYLYVGFNEKSYSEAADEIGEFVDDGWHKDVQKLFRDSVRSMRKLFGESKTLDEVASLMRPGAEAAQVAKLAALKAEAEKAAAEAAAPKAA